MSLDEVVAHISGIITEKLDGEKKNKTQREMMPVNPIDKTAKLGFFRSLGYNFVRICVKLAFKIWYKIEFVGKENIPKKGGHIFASTHRSYADPVFLAIAGRTPLSFMAKEELFQGNKFFAWLIGWLGAFPVKRGKGDTEAIDRAIEELNKGRNLIIFPEGTRSKDGKVGKIKTGVALIGAVAQATIVPTAIIFEGKLKFRKKIILAFAPPVEPSELGVNSTSARELKILKNRISDDINNLVNENVNKL